MNLHNKLMSRTRHQETKRLITFREFLKLHYFQAIPAESLWPEWREPEKYQDFWDITFMIPGALLHESLLGRVLAILQEEKFFCCNLVAQSPLNNCHSAERNVPASLCPPPPFFFRFLSPHTWILATTPNWCPSTTSHNILQWFYGLKH